MLLNVYVQSGDAYISGGHTLGSALVSGYMVSYLGVA